MDTVKSILSSRGVQAAVVGMGVAAAMKYAENNRKESDTCEIAKNKFDDDDEPIPVLYEGEKLNQARVIWFQSPPDVVILHQVNEIHRQTGFESYFISYLFSTNFHDNF